jgi:polyisoprenyl-phosphate glycosyltransferase
MMGSSGRQKVVAIVLPTFNEVENITALVSRIKASTDPLDYKFELIFIDNSSNDGTSELLIAIAETHPSVKLIFNETNFGHIRSPYYGLLQTDADAVILMASDLQDPPELIPKYIEEWEKGFNVVLGVKSDSKEGFIMKSLRRRYYSVLSKLSDTNLVRNATGSGLFDRRVIDTLRDLNDPYPYFRGLVVELGFKVSTVPFVQPKRSKGKTKNNFFTLIDIGILGLVSQSTAPIRLITIFGFLTGILSFLVALVYLIAKLTNWDSFELGLAPLIVGVFFFGSVQIFLIGLIGEYLSNILRRLKGLPLVIESKRINFDK